MKKYILLIFALIALSSCGKPMMNHGMAPPISHQITREIIHQSVNITAEIFHRLLFHGR